MKKAGTKPQITMDSVGAGMFAVELGWFLCFCFLFFFVHAVDLLE